jgi:hypothetical protein
MGWRVQRGTFPESRSTLGPWKDSGHTVMVWFFVTWENRLPKLGESADMVPWLGTFWWCLLPGWKISPMNAHWAMVFHLFFEGLPASYVWWNQRVALQNYCGILNQNRVPQLGSQELKSLWSELVKFLGAFDSSRCCHPMSGANVPWPKVGL